MNYMDYIYDAKLVELLALAPHHRKVLGKVLLEEENA